MAKKVDVLKSEKESTDQRIQLRILKETWSGSPPV